MNKNRIHLLLGFNTLVLYGLIFFLMRDLEVGQLVVIGIAMAAMMISVTRWTMERSADVSSDITSPLRGRP